jgi:hypothetical protein
VYNPDQADADNDLVGDLCDSISEKLIEVPAGLKIPGETLWVKATFENNSTQDIEMIKPDCYNTAFVLKKESGEIIYPNCILRVPYDIPGDVITMPAGSSATVNCDLSEKYPPEVLPSTVADLTVRAIYSNSIRDLDYNPVTHICSKEPCFDLWTGSIESSEQQISIDGSQPKVTKKQAQIVFSPAQWDVAWASSSGPPITASISNVTGHAISDINPSTIKLNGKVPIIAGSDTIQSGVLRVQFNAKEAVESLGTAIPGTSAYPTLEGGFYSTANEIFYGQGRVDLYDRVLSNVLVVRPNGGEAVPSGSSYYILWQAPSNAVKFDLKYSTNNGTTWKPIANKVTGSSYNWAVPAPLKNKTKCFVKVIGYDVSGTKVGKDKSNGPFTIEAIGVISPNGGETLYEGQTWNITWRTNGTASPVAFDKIYYTDDGGATWKFITPRIDNLGYYPWEVPYVPSDKNKCKVKVVLKAADGTTVGSDISDGFFTIERQLSP